MDGFTACPALGDPTGSSRLQGDANATKSTDAITTPENRKARTKAGFFGSCCGDWRSLGDSNPCFSLERATS